MQEADFDTHGRVARYNIRPNMHMGQSLMSDVNEAYQPMQSVQMNPPPIMSTLPDNRNPSYNSTGKTMLTNAGAFQIPSYNNNTNHIGNMSDLRNPTASPGWHMNSSSNNNAFAPSELMCTHVNAHVQDCVICKQLYITSGYARTPTLVVVGVLALVIVALLIFIFKSRVLVVDMGNHDMSQQQQQQGPASTGVPPLVTQSAPWKYFVSNKRIRLKGRPVATSTSPGPTVVASANPLQQVVEVEIPQPVAVPSRQVKKNHHIMSGPANHSSMYVKNNVESHSACIDHLRDFLRARESATAEATPEVQASHGLHYDVFFKECTWHYGGVNKSDPDVTEVAKPSISS